MARKSKLPPDYEQCSICGYDHDYEPNETFLAHQRLIRQQAYTIGIPKTADIHGVTPSTIKKILRIG